MERKYFATATVLLNIANGDKLAQEKAERIEAYLVEITNAMIDHVLYQVDLESSEETVEELQSTFKIPPISG